MFLDILFDKCHQFELKDLLLLVVVSFKNSEIGLWTLDDEVLDQFDIHYQLLLKILDLNLFLRVNNHFVFAFKQKQKVFDYFSKGMVLRLELFDQSYLLCYNWKHLLQKTFLILFLFIL